MVLGILITGLLSGIIGVVAYFGQFLGTFVIGVDEEAHRTGIILSETEDFTTAYPHLMVNPINNTVPVAYDDLKINEVMVTDGNYHDPSGLTYIGYTFYIKNEGDTIVDLELNVDITDVSLNVDAATRIMIIEDDRLATIYKKHDEVPLHIYDLTPVDITKDFESETKIVKSLVEDFRPNEIKKYTVIIWLEGWDEDCTDDIKTGNIKMAMEFSIISSRLEEENN